MNLRSAVASAIVLILAVASGYAPASAAPDTIYRAGSMLGRNLYWLPEAGLNLDTLGWQAAWQIATNRDPDTNQTFKQALPAVRASGSGVYRLDNASAITVSLVRQMGYPVFLVTQWHAALAQKVVVPRPGLVQTAFRHVVLSEYLWELIDRSEMIGRTAGGDDKRIRIYFRDAGYCEYDGKDECRRVDKQMLGIQGFSVHVPEASYDEDMNVRRIIMAIFVLVPLEKKPSDFQKELEKAIDREKLDLSYRLPDIKAVK